MNTRFLGLPLCVLLAGCPLQAERISDADKSGDSSEPNDSADTGCELRQFWADSDGDGFGNVLYLLEICELPFGYADNSDDCDDMDAAVNPITAEICDGTDNDCSGTADDAAIDAPIWYQDQDQDEFGNGGVSAAACSAPEGYVAIGGDCNDLDGSITLGETWFTDDDADGWGTEPVVACDQPVATATYAGDCDDADPEVSPGATESCNELDDDCDDQADEGASDALIWYADRDSDGYGTPNETTMACTIPEGFVDSATDCDDGLAAVSPDATEICSGVDNDCDGLVDDADPDVTGALTWYQDADGDNFGAVTSTVSACARPAGYVPNGDDCDDAQPAVFPAAEELCNFTDDNCDGSVDEAATDAVIWFADADDDTYGDATASLIQCEQPAGYVENLADCDDSDADASPDGTETCDDTIDQDCDGVDETCQPFVDYTTMFGSLMVAISAGSFTMGGGASDPSDIYTDHEVTLTHNFWLGQTEITRSQWESTAANAGWTYISMPLYPCSSSTGSGNCPADSMSWSEAAIYTNVLSAAEGLTACYLADGSELAVAYISDPYTCPGYRLPTEAEWEFAAAAGEDTEFPGSNTASSVAWYDNNTFAVGSFVHAVATLAPNAWGLYDMGGNVYERVNDWYDVEYGLDGSGGAVSTPVGPTAGSERVIRGGAWYYADTQVRVTDRDGYDSSVRNNDFGFRLARSIP